MRFTRKLTLNNYLSYAFMLILVASFILAFLFAFAPTMPDLPQYPAQLRWFVSSWNLAGPLMFIVVFRIHALRRIFKALTRKPTIGVTPWVRFWFLAATFFGLATIPYLAHSFLQKGSSFFLIDLLTLSTVASWGLLVALTVWINRMSSKHSSRKLRCVKKSQKTHQWLLAPSSAVFFIFTGIYSFIILLA